MTIGITALCRLVGALFYVVGNAFDYVADWAWALGDPEINTPSLLIVVALVASGNYKAGVFALLVLCLADLIFKDFVGSFPESK